jgi:hypothetical protein
LIRGKNSFDTAFRHALLVRRLKELLDCQSCFCDQAAQRASCNFRMIGYRESSHVALPSHDDMAPFLADDLPAKALKDLDNVGWRENGNRRHYAMTST